MVRATRPRRGISLHTRCPAYTRVIWSQVGDGLYRWEALDTLVHTRPPPPSLRPRSGVRWPCLLQEKLTKGQRWMRWSTDMPPPFSLLPEQRRALAAPAGRQFGPTAV
eukprot:258194-Chlamydomonas_euryale.AAC.2